MNRETLLRNIEEALKSFSSGKLEINALQFFETLGYRSERRISGLNLDAENLAEAFDSPQKLRPEKALSEKGGWRSVDLLFQLTDDEIHASSQLRMTFDSQRKVDASIYRSYLFFAVGLKEKQYTRTQLADATREINRLFAIPVMVLFQYGELLTLAVIQRRPNRRETDKDVLEKVTLIKDIHVRQPNRAHIEILTDLSLEQLYERYRFTNFLELHQAWQETLNITELNKNFYKDLSNWFFWAVGQVRFPPGADKDEKKRNSINIIRLITRLIFVWFIKEKGLVPEDLFDQRKLEKFVRFGNPDETIYYKAVLQNLFFATLNTEMNQDVDGSREFAKVGNSIVDDYLVTNKYRYQEFFITPDRFKELCENIPFLNGGLFECLDRVINDDDLLNDQKIRERAVKEGSHLVLRVDGFSRRKENPLKVPDKLFFSKGELIDLNKELGTKNKKYEVRGLIEILNHYKFTIEENTPIEEEVALDPELLGKVFENLLAAYNPETETTARKQTGSFYTPREIVNYMVDESLLAYLEGKLKSSSDVPVRLRHLLDYNTEPPKFDETETNTIVKAIDDVKVLDPACGSGAFPMGILHKLVYILQRLDKDNSRWQELQRQKAIHETEDAYKIGDREKRQDRLMEIEDAFANNTDDYGRKLYLIENCIYGVDIQPIAVQIAKLRFFISLIVEQGTKQALSSKIPNLGIRPLPNLETKFVAANTLMRIEKPKADTAITFGDHLIAEKRAELKELRHKHFSIRRTRDKREHSEEDKRLRKQLASLLQGVWQSDAEKLAAWDPYDPNSSADFFDPDWMFINDSGFDILIENPPFGAELNKIQKDYLKKRHEHIAERIRNSFLYFIGESFNLAKDGGVICMILPNEFLFQIYMTKARKYFLENARFLFAINVGDDVFEAIVPTCVIGLVKSKVPNYEIPVADLRDSKLEELPTLLTTETFTKTSNTTFLSAPNAIFSFDKGVAKLINRLAADYQPFESFCNDVANGISTSCDEVYIVPGDFARDRGFEKEYLKECIRGGQFNRFYCPVHTDEFVLYVTNKFSPKIGKNIYKYLGEHKDLLIRKSVEKKQGKRDWHILFRGRYENLFKKPKILFRQTGDRIIAAVDYETEYYCIDSVNVGKIKSEYIDYLGYFIGLLNSRLMVFYYQEISQEKSRILAQVKPQRIRSLPICIGTQQQRLIIKRLVNYLSTLHSNPDAETIPSVPNRIAVQLFEDLLNGLVYELYFPESILTKELGVFNLTESVLAEGIETTYKTLRDSNGQIRARLVRQNIEVEEIKIINEALKK